MECVKLRFVFVLLSCTATDTHAIQINTITREKVEEELQFAGFLVFHCPLKPDAISTIKELNSSSHRCVMITGDNPLTAAHVAMQVEIVDREVLILDHREGSADEAGQFVMAIVKLAADARA